MGTDWVRLFDLGLARRIARLDRDGLARWLDENLDALKEKACRRAEQDARSLAETGLVDDREKLRAETCEEYASEWERRRDEVRAAGALRPELRDQIAEEAAVEGERELHMDYWGCYAEVFSSHPDGALSSTALLSSDASRIEERFLLLLPEHVDRMLRSLRQHRHEWRIMNDERLRRLADFRERCARDRELRVAYYFDL